MYGRDAWRHVRFVSSYLMHSLLEDKRRFLVEWIRFIRSTDGPVAAPIERVACLRGGGPPPQFHQGGRRIARHPGGDQPPGERARGPSWREAVSTVDAQPAADRGRQGAVARPTRRVRSNDPGGSAGAG